MSFLKRVPWELVISLLLFAAILAACVVGLRGAERDREARAASTLADNLRRAAVTCYAIEGCYPATLDYLTSNYGVHVDGGRYSVEYEIFASNIMPDITVIER